MAGELISVLQRRYASGVGRSRIRRSYRSRSVTDLNMPFWSMVRFMVKWAIGFSSCLPDPYRSGCRILARGGRNWIDSGKKIARPVWH